MLHDVPDFEERHQFLESLKNKFEASLSPRLVAAFDDHATGKCGCGQCDCRCGQCVCRCGHRMFVGMTTVCLWV